MKRTATLLAIAFTILSGWNTIASAQCAMDQDQPQDNGGTSERNLPGYYDWQSFTAGISGGLCQVDVMFCNSNVQLSGTGTLNIYSGTGISGTLLTSQAVTVNGTATALNLPFWQSFAIAAPPAVTAGQVYTWQFIPTQAGGLPDPYLIQVYIPDAYAGGVSYNFGTGGDIAFATYVDPATGTTTISPENNFVVYPNPASDYVTVKTNAVDIGASYFVRDQLGRIVSAGKLAAEISAIDIHELPAGIYFLEITGEDQRLVKIVKE